MKKLSMVKLLGTLGVMGMTIASVASFWVVHEPKRPSALKK